MNNLIWLTLLSVVDTVISRGTLVPLVIEPWYYRRAGAKAQPLALVTAVCTRATTGGKGTRGAISWASAPGNTVFIDAEALTMLTPMWCYQHAKQYRSVSSACCTGSTRVTSLTFIQVLLSCIGERRSWALAFLCSSIITWSPSVILWGGASPLPSTLLAHGWRRATGLVLPGQGRGLVHTRFPRHICYDGLVHSSRVLPTLVPSYVQRDLRFGE